MRLRLPLTNTHFFLKKALNFPNNAPQEAIKQPSANGM